MAGRRSSRTGKAGRGQTGAGIGMGALALIGVLALAVLALSFMLYQERGKSVRPLDTEEITKSGETSPVKAEHKETINKAHPVKKVAQATNIGKVKFEDIVEERAVELAHEGLDRAGYPAHARNKSVIDRALPSCRKRARVQVKMWMDTKKMGEKMGASDYQIEKAINMMNPLSVSYVDNGGVPDELIKTILERCMKSLRDRRGRR